MNRLIILMYILLLLLCLLLGINFSIYLYLYFNKNYVEKISKKYEGIILDYIFQKKRKKELELLLNQKTIKYSIFTEKAIEIINLLKGEYRKKIIELCDELNLSNILIKKLKSHRTNKTAKELMLYQIGELRSKEQLKFFLNIDIDYIKKYDLYKGYFFLVNSIVNEWIYELDDKEIKKYIDLVFLMIEKTKDSTSVNTKKLFEIFLTDTSSLFKYMINKDGIRKYMVNSLITKDIPLSYKGEIIYIMVLNFEYRINNFIKKEFSKYIKSEELSSDQLNYLIFLIKSLGEMGLKDGYISFKEACRSNNWAIKAIASKYIYKYDEKETYDFLESFLRDSSWWVRKNAALSLDKLGFLGIEVMIRTLKSQDRFAQEIASFTLATGTYFFYFKNKLLKEGKYLFGFDQILETYFGKDFLERILFDRDIPIEDKKNIIKKQNYKNYESYFLTLINRAKLTPDLYNYIKEIIEKSGGLDERIN